MPSLNAFKDCEVLYLSYQLHWGVWRSDGPFDGNEGADWVELLVVEIPAEIAAG